eukprot:s97_g27.t8
MDLGGAIGAYFDFVNENRAIARELGGVEMFIQNIRNNFHGQYSDWANEPVKQSLYALSSGTWTNGDIAYHEGFPSLGVQLMKEHGNETKIAEETLQAVKAMAFESDFYRSRWSELGIFEALPGVLYDNPTDQGAISLVCEATLYVIGTDTPMGDPVSSLRIIPFNASIQERATKDKMLEALLATAMSDAELEQFDHDSFNFNLDMAYPAKRTLGQLRGPEIRNCLGALLAMGKECNLCSRAAVGKQDNPANLKAMREAGLTQSIRKEWETFDLLTRTTACMLLERLGVEVNLLCPVGNGSIDMQIDRAMQFVIDVIASVVFWWVLLFTEYTDLQFYIFLGVLAAVMLGWRIYRANFEEKSELEDRLPYTCAHVRANNRDLFLVATVHISPKAPRDVKVDHLPLATGNVLTTFLETHKDQDIGF